MANNITIRQLNNGVYDSLLPRTTASKSYLTNDTSALYNLQNGTAEQAIQAIMRVIALSGNVSMRITDANGNPVVGAIVNGLVGSPISDENGNVQGIYEYTPVNIVSPYVDLQDKSVDVKNYIGSINVLTVRLDTYAENTVRRYTDSRNVRFSKMVKTVDVCCVGGGGGGGVTLTPESGSYGYASGGGGGAINNSYGISVIYNQPYSIVVASGAAAYSGDQEHQTRGGTTTAFGISSQGGYSAYHLDPPNYDKKAGLAAMAGCGDGAQYGNGNSNNTISEFNDGVTFYSGGGASGTLIGGQSVFTGGSPNGANGAHAEYMNVINASQAGIGGGGGGGSSYYAAGREYKGNASAGGPGLVAIRLHFS